MTVINLQKGQRIDLTKGNSSLSKIVVGLGWDPIEQSRGGFLGNLFGGSTDNIDCDASAIMLNSQGKLVHTKDSVVYFGKLESNCSSIRHTGDNLTGDGDGDDEQIIVDLSRVPANVQRIVFTVNIYDCINRKQHFGMIENCFIRVFNPDDRNKELCKYNLTENYTGMTALIVGEIYRHNGEWKFAATGEATKASSIGNLVASHYA